MQIKNLAVALVGLAFIVTSQTGCGLHEVRLKSKGGVEYRHKNHDKTDSQRYLVQEAVQFKWDNGVDTSVIYRRRDVSESPSGDHDDGVWFEIGIPIWKAPKKADSKGTRIATLEYRIAKLEAALGSKPASAGSVKSQSNP